MKSACEPFAGKKITLMGLGLLGRGVGDAEFLAECGARLVVTDKKTESELAESVARLKEKHPDIVFHLGGHQLKDFTEADMVVKAAGVPLDSPEIAAARERGVPVVMSTALFAKYAAEMGAIIVGITGTRGKSTTAQMIFHVLRQVGRRAHLGGNVRGVSTLAMLPELKKGDICVLELDSWQLQGFGDLRISPHVAVFTNLMPDHLNYYGGDMQQYFADKANIFRFQEGKDALIINPALVDEARSRTPSLDSSRVVRYEPISDSWKLRILGEHNRYNASLARLALRALGVPDDSVRTGIESFEGVEGRLQFVREIKGVKIYNDNNATTPEATIAALKALDPKAKRTVVLIMGGADKGLDMSGVRAAVHAHCKSVVFLAGTGTERIRKDAPDTPVLGSLKEALTAALKAAAAGDAVLFSPGFASFGMFKNEYDRNDQFMELVHAL